MLADQHLGMSHNPLKRSYTDGRQDQAKQDKKDSCETNVHKSPDTHAADEAISPRFRHLSPLTNSDVAFIMNIQKVLLCKTPISCKTAFGSGYASETGISFRVCLPVVHG